MKTTIKKFLLIVIPSILLIYLDQITKNYASLYFKTDKLVVINNILEFTYHENRGAAFGIMQNQHIIFYILTIIIMLLIIYYINKLELSKKNFPIFICLILIISGAIGNFINRLINKYVIDFIYFKPIDFPVFNLADTYITIAVFLFLFLSIFIYKDKDIL